MRSHHQRSDEPINWPPRAQRQAPTTTRSTQEQLQQQSASELISQLSLVSQEESSRGGNDSESENDKSRRLHGQQQPQPQQRPQLDPRLMSADKGQHSPSADGRRMIDLDDHLGLVNNNRFLIKLANVCCSLEFPLNRFSFSESKCISNWLARLRLCIFLWVLIRMVVFWIFQSCEYGQLRAYLFDWTTFYPESRRTGLIRSFICLCLFQLAMKRSILFGKTVRKKFDPSLIDYLCELPPGAPIIQSGGADKNRKSTASNSEQAEAEKEEEDDEDDDDVDMLFERELREQLAQDPRSARRLSGPPVPYYLTTRTYRHDERTPPASPLTINMLFSSSTTAAAAAASSLSLRERLPNGDNDSVAAATTAAAPGDDATRAEQVKPNSDKEPTKRNSIDLRNQEHWFYVSRRLRRAAIRTFVYIFPLSFLIIVSATRRILFVHQISRKCDQFDNAPVTRLVGALEVAYCLAESLFSLLGLSLHTRLVALDVRHQINVIERELSQMDEKLKGGGTGSGNGGASGITDMYKNHQLNSPFSVSNYLSLNYYKQQQANMISLFNQQIDVNFFDQLFQPKEFCCWNSKTRTSSSSSSPSSLFPATLDDQVWFHSLIENLNGRKSTLCMEHLGSSSNEHELATIQTKVIQMLVCIDSHKPVVEFLGNAQYIWMASSLSFVPLITFNRNMSYENKVGIFIYIYLSLVAILACIRFTFVCASVNQRALRLAGLIFRICANSRKKQIIRRWNKIFMIWYCPNRCAFRVGGVIDLTYVNILKTISFLLSGITLMLNYAND